MSTKQNPPAWCSDAVATARGWTHPKTGEILISRRGLVVSEVAVEAPVDIVAEVEAPVEIVAEVKQESHGKAKSKK